MSINKQEFDAKDDSDSEGSVEELCEPKFKYKRLLNDFVKIFEKDAASCVAVHDKFIVLGTHWGRVYILDHLGNVVIQRVPDHTAAVNQISIDCQGDVIASCSNDGKVIFFGSCSTERSQTVLMGRPIRSIAVGPDYLKTEQFCTGDRDLIFHEKAWFARDKQHTVFVGKDMDGFIHNIVWRKCYICFANDTGVRVYDKDIKALITHVPRRHDIIDLRSELFPASITWLDDSLFAIGWANTVTVCTVKAATSASGSSLLLPTGPVDKYAEIIHLFEFPNDFIAGISYTTPDKYLVLFCISRDAKALSDGSDIGHDNPAASSAATGQTSSFEEPKCPRVLLVESVGLQEYEVISEDIIIMRDANKLMCHNCYLAGLGSDNLYFLLGSQEMISFKPCNPDDHVYWLLNNGLYKKALEFTKDNEHSLELYNSLTVGQQYLENLIAEGDFASAAKLCAEVCNKKKDLWEAYVTRFEQLGQLKMLATELPSKDPQLEPECYEMVLLDFLKDNVAGFKRFVNQWSPDLYRVGAIIKEALDKLYKINSTDKDSYQDLLEVLAQLYAFERNYDRALALYLKLKHRNVFQLIERYRLFPHVKDKIQDLMVIDTNLAVRLLLDNEDSLPSGTVMKQLSKQPKLQLAYLDRLFSRNEGAEFGNLAVSLYAEHDQKRLLPFLRNNTDYYKLDKALELCRQRGLVDAEVFLLARSGDRRAALRVIMSSTRNISGAIEFCKEHDDVDLWNDLIAYAVTNPVLVTTLMQNIGTYVDPTLLLRQIPQQMNIPGLRDSLVKTLQDYSTQIALQEGCQRVLVQDCHALQLKLVSTMQCGRRVDTNSYCSLCDQIILRNQFEAKTATNLVLYNCGHIAHQRCLHEHIPVGHQASNAELCYTCVSQDY